MVANTKFSDVTTTKCLKKYSQVMPTYEICFCGLYRTAKMTGITKKLMYYINMRGFYCNVEYKLSEIVDYNINYNSIHWYQRNKSIVMDVFILRLLFLQFKIIF